MQIPWEALMRLTRQYLQYKINVKRKNKGWRFAILFIIRGDIMKKGIISIFVNSDITKEEIEEIRKQYNEEEYKLNIFVSGKDDLKINLKNFLKS